MSKTVLIFVNFVLRVITTGQVVKFRAVDLRSSQFFRTEKV